MVRIVAALAALVFVLGSAPRATAQKKEMVQLQRDMAILQDAMRQLDRKNSERLAGLEALLKQNLEKQDKINAGLAVIERNISAQGDSLIGPMNTTSAKVDSLADQFVGLRTAVEETNAMLTRLQQEVDDIKTHLTTLPPPSFGEGEEGEGSGAIDGGGLSAGDAIFEGGMSDYLRGNLEIARDQFKDYLALYPEHSRAPDAQYFLAQTFYAEANYSDAARAFDLVLEKYPVVAVSSEAQYKKGLSLLNQGQKDAAAREFQAVLDRFPNSSIAPNAAAELARIQGGKPSPGR